MLATNSATIKGGTAADLLRNFLKLCSKAGEVLQPQRKKPFQTLQENKGGAAVCVSVQHTALPLAYTIQLFCFPPIAKFS